MIALILLKKSNNIKMKIYNDVFIKKNLKRTGPFSQKLTTKDNIFLYPPCKISQKLLLI